MFGHPDRPARPHARRGLRLGLEALEDRTVPATEVLSDPLAATNSYLDDWVGLASAFPPADPVAPGAPFADLAAFAAPFVLGGAGGGFEPAAVNPDPSARGAFAVTRQVYTFGDTAFRPTAAAGNFNPGIELTASIHAPTDLSQFSGPLPVVVLLHGRHQTTYAPGTPGGALEWPPAAGRVSAPSFAGYDYLAENLASHGYVVVSVSANGINARDNNVTDLGMIARGELVQRHLRILQDLTTTGTVTAQTGDTLTGELTPFGDRYVGRLDLQNVGTMGHSRGGEGVVRHYLINQAQGSPFGIRAVFALAPVDFSRPVINNVPLAVLLPYNDGDVSDLQGVHFYDDARYNVPGDTAPKHTIFVNGASHNLYNTVWTPTQFQGASAGDDYTGSGQGTIRIGQTPQQLNGLTYMAAFFRTYLGGVETFQPILRGDFVPLSAGTSQTYVSYHAPDTAATRRDVNRTTTFANLTTNTLGGAVLTSGLTDGTGTGAQNQGPYRINVTAGGQVTTPLIGVATSQQPHNVPSARSAAPGLTQILLGYNTPGAFWENQLPDAADDVSDFFALQFRISVTFPDIRNPVGQPSDFTVRLTDRAGNSATTLAGSWAPELFYPPGPTPNFNTRALLNTVRIPLAAFAGVDLNDVASVRFEFDQRPSGHYMVTDLAFADPAGIYAGSYVADIARPAADTVLVRFGLPVDPATFTADDVTITGPGGAPVTVLSVTPVAGSGNSRFEVRTAPLPAGGLYRVAIGPNVLDTFGNALDQDFDGVTGESGQDGYQAGFGTGARIVPLTPTTPAVTPVFPQFGPVSTGQVNFNTAINPATFTADDIVITGPGGAAVTVLSVTPVAGTGNTRFNYTFTPQNAAGIYTVVIGPDVRDAFGDQLDQDGDFTPGEADQDRWVSDFRIRAPRITTLVTTGAAGGTVRVTFDTAIDPAEFTAGDVTVTGPGGAAVGVTGVTAVAGSGNTQFDIAFGPPAVSGAYTLTVGPDVRDVRSNPMDQDYDFTAGEAVDDRFVSTFNVTVAGSPGVIQFSAATYSVGESGGSATITLTRTGGSTGAVSVTVATSNGTATAGADYTAVSTVVNFAAGATSATATVPILGDSVFEGNETVNLTLSAPTGGATLGTQTTAVLTITDDPAPTFSINDVTVTEGNAGTVSAVFTVTLSGATALPATVQFATAGGTATSGVDFQPASGTLTFAVGVTTQTVTVLVNGDTAPEPTETFVVNLSAPTGATISDGQGVGTILDDDAAPAALVNGGFETPAVGTGTFGAFQYNPTGAGAGWTFSPSSGVAGNGSGFTAGNPNAPEGTQVGFLQNQGSVAQTVSLAAGTYQVTFRAAQRGNFNEGNQTVRVTVGGVVVGEFTPAGAAYETFATTSFTLPTAGTREVRLEGLGGPGDRTAFVDLVQVVAAPTAIPLANAGFETPAVGSGTFGAFQYNPAGAGWTFSPSSGVAGNGSGFTAGNPNAPQGTQVGFLQGTGSVSQQVTLTAGTYQLTFRAAQRGNFQPVGPQTVRAQLAEVAGSAQTFVPTGTDYQVFGATFTVGTAGTYTVVLDGLTAGDSTAFLDDVLLARVG
jgi:hypothetical protein